MSDKKLLYVINHLDWFWSHRLPLAVGAQNDGWDVSVAATGASKDEQLAERNFKGLELPASHKGFTPLAVLKTILAIHAILKGEKPDVLHAITLKYSFMAGLAARFHKNVRVVHTIAGLGYLFSSEGIKPKLLRSIVGPFLILAFKQTRTHIIFQNPDDKSEMVKRGFAYPQQCHLIRGSGVDLSQFPFVKEAPQRIEPIVLLPTRLVHDKGIAVFIEAARLVKAQGIPARFQIAGDIVKENPFAISIKEMESMIADGAVEWLGKVENMPSLYAVATLICYPSYYGEGIPKVLLEAAATGRAIVTTDHPGCREVVTHGENGLLVPVKDAKATAEAVIFLLNNDVIREKMGYQSRKRAKDQYDVKLIVKHTLNVYDTVIIP